MALKSEDTDVLYLINIDGRVTHVDENSALITARQSSCEIYKAKLTGISILRKSTFKKVVSEVSDFLFVDDDVVVNIKQNKPTEDKWKVTRVRLCPSQRPPPYDVVRDYFVWGKHGPARWPKKKTCHVPRARVGEIVSLMSEVLQRWCKIPIELFHDVVDENCNDLGGVFESYIKTKRALMSFIRTVPQHFYMDNNRVCMYEGFDNELFKAELAERCMSIPQWTRSYPLSAAQVVQTVRHGYAVLQPLLERAERLYETGSNPGLVVALDCEGCCLSKTGRLTLVQISTMEGKVYLFDVFICPYLFQDGLLAEFLESKAVLKVIHDCRKDTAALYHQFGVTLTNIFDTSIAYLVLQNQCQVAGTKPRPRISFQNLCEMVGEEIDVTVKKSIKKKMMYIYDFWARRPLNADMITYAAADVYMLLPNVYQALDRLIHPNWKRMYQLMCQEAIREEIEDM